ncbi:DNA-binding protein [Chromatiales bacterium (ex Bugula neritina AB1)]|nr:DNA-binding protein [Chromatiales bacterium (ex Bugula neritina AB1)]
MNIKPVRTAKDHKAALARIAELMDASPDSPQEDELDVLTTLVETWEAREIPVGPPEPIAAIEFRMEQLGLTRKDLEPLIGHRGRVSEVLSGKRGLSLTMIRGLHRELSIPLEVLVGEHRPNP